ncbi:hypothetical protein, partial [Salmonella enterica]|uniref:hypothetical protein n=1 Tax=Salmonella enterica TaxID=28901 RepID=UPI003298AF46
VQVFPVTGHAGEAYIWRGGKERIRRVQLHVGLRKGSPGEFTCTQSLPLGALLDGRIRILTHFLWPEISVDCEAGQGYI